MKRSRPTGSEIFFATCAPGIEPVLHAEVAALGFARIERQVGGVSFSGSAADARRANLWLRTAVRVLMRVARFGAEDADALYAGVREVDWRRFLGVAGRFVVDAHCRESQLDHTRFVEQRVKDAVVDQFRERHGGRPEVERETADLGIYTHLYRDRCTLSVDTSGEPLHKRGWRRAQGRAPLAENLAAAVVLSSGWDRRAPLLDPFCGSGTVPIEAAMIAADIAPGLFRPEHGFGFERWPGHETLAWERELDAARERAQLPRKLRILASDWNPETVADARENLAAADLEDAVEVELADARAFAPRPGWNGWIVSNLPYGQRVGKQREILELDRDFGDVLRRRCGGYHVALLCGDDAQARALGLEGAEVDEIVNGGLSCRLVRTRIGD